MGFILSKDVEEEAGDEYGIKKQRLEKKEYLGRGTFKTVFLTKIGETYYAKSEGWALDSTFDDRLKYVIKGLDDFTTELGVWLGWDYMEDTEEHRLKYMAQMKYSAFEITFMNAGSPDGVQSVISTKDYRYKRIDFTYSPLNVYNQLDLLFFNITETEFYTNFKTKSEQQIIDPIKPLTNREFTNKLQKVNDFYNYLCVFYDITKESIVLDTSLNITKDEFKNNSEPFLNKYLVEVKSVVYYYKNKTNKTENDRKIQQAAEIENELIKNSIETDWDDFNYVFNTLRPVYGGIMNYLEEHVFSKDENFKKKVDLEFENTILNTELIN